ncbi:hypothetical protein Hanom_Chr10g00966631 [Helianthus anomalus]
MEPSPPHVVGKTGGNHHAATVARLRHHYRRPTTTGWPAVSFLGSLPAVIRSRRRRSLVSDVLERESRKMNEMKGGVCLRFVY